MAQVGAECGAGVKAEGKVVLDAVVSIASENLHVKIVERHNIGGHSAPITFTGDNAPKDTTSEGTGTLTTVNPVILYQDTTSYVFTPGGGALDTIDFKSNSGTVLGTWTGELHPPVTRSFSGTGRWDWIGMPPHKAEEKVVLDAVVSIASEKLHVKIAERHDIGGNSAPITFTGDNAPKDTTSEGTGTLTTVNPVILYQDTTSYVFTPGGGALDTIDFKSNSGTVLGTWTGELHPPVTRSFSGTGRWDWIGEGKVVLDAEVSIASEKLHVKIVERHHIGGHRAPTFTGDNAPKDTTSGGIGTLTTANPVILYQNTTNYVFTPGRRVVLDTIDFKNNSGTVLGTWAGELHPPVTRFFSGTGRWDDWLGMLPHADPVTIK